MTEQEIEVFLTVAQTGSLSGAAQALYITQPAESRHIRALERELGCPLLIRGKGVRRIELTGHGHVHGILLKWRKSGVRYGRRPGNWHHRTGTGG